MTFYPRLLLRCEFEVVEIGDEVTAVSVGDESNEYHGVIKLNNDPARFMFEKLQEGISMPELVLACMDRYKDSTVDEIGPNVLAFLDKLRDQGLLVADTTKGFRVDDSKQ